MSVLKALPVVYFLRQLRGWRLQELVLEQGDFYEKDWTSAGMRQWQLERFNQQWQCIVRSVPYFQHLQRQKNLPDRFSTWAEFKELMPVMERKTVQDHVQALTSGERRPDYWRVTGSSTAEPLHIPTWKAEREVTTKDLWYGRSWFGVKPSDRLFLIWGHSHLLGRGVRGWLNGNRQHLKDVLLGYYRHSAYDLSEKSLRRAAAALLEFKPSYILGYAVALDRFARLSRCDQTAFHSLGLKVAIATAESFPRAESAGLIAGTLGCQVAMEYGAVETGPIAHQRPDGRYRVFWRHLFLEGYESEHLPGAYEIFVTSLYPRCFPLIRYRVGDLISENPDDESFNQEFGAVIGRCNDIVVLRNGSVMHSEAFSHAVREASSIAAYQIVQDGSGDIRLNYTAPEPLAAKEMSEIRRRLTKINPELVAVRIERLPSLPQTIAGKTRRIIREEPPAA